MNFSAQRHAGIAQKIHNKTPRSAVFAMIYVSNKHDSIYIGI